jgi:hypothetical protein
MTSGQRLVLAATALALLPTAAQAQRLEIEGAAGFGGVPQFPIALADDPVFSMRAGVDLWGFFAPGVRFTGVVGRPRRDPVSGAQPDRAWTLLAEARLHTPGRVQALLDLGLGAGRIIPHDDEPGVAFQIGAGIRGFVTPALAIGGGIAVPVWTQTRAFPQAQPASKGGDAFWVNVAVLFGQ